MLGALSAAALAFVVAVVLLAGVLTGVAGFGFALVGTMALATVLPPSTAVVLLIVPLLASNASLLGELDPSDLRACATRFGPYAGAALAGTVVGMAALDAVPETPLRLALGLLTLGFVASQQRRVRLTVVETVEERCFAETGRAMAIVGAVSGAVFGATNVGVQVVAYLRSCDLPEREFVGVIAMVFLGINAARFVLAAVFGLYPSLEAAALSVALVAPGLLGIAVGKRLRPRLPDRSQRLGVLGLLGVIGVRLVLGGLGVA